MINTFKYMINCGSNNLFNFQANKKITPKKKRVASWDIKY